MASTMPIPATIPDIHDPRPLLRERLIANYARLRTFAAQRLPGNGEAEDLVHNVFLCIEQVPCGRVIDNPDAYLFTIASNLRIVALKQQHRIAVLDVDRLLDGRPVESLIVEDCAAGTGIDSDARIAMLREVLEQLPSRCRGVMQMRYVHGLSRDQIARKLGITVDGVKKHLKRGLVECRRRMRRLA